MFTATLKIALGTALVAFLAAEFLSYRTSVGSLPALPKVFATGSRLAPRGGEPERVASAAGYGRVELAPDRLGQFHAMVEIDGRRLPMLVDTGASYVALTYADAASVGLRPMPSDFTVKLSTANGMSAAASVRLGQVRLDTILVDDVPAIVLPRGMSATSLLGMSFLKKLGGFEIDAGNLVLKP